jgi:hypothetical protein
VSAQPTTASPHPHRAHASQPAPASNASPALPQATSAHPSTSSNPSARQRPMFTRVIVDASALPAHRTSSTAHRQAPATGLRPRGARNFALPTCAERAGPFDGGQVRNVAALHRSRSSPLRGEDRRLNAPPLTASQRGGGPCAAWRRGRPHRRSVHHELKASEALGSTGGVSPLISDAVAVLARGKQRHVHPARHRRDRAGHFRLIQSTSPTSRVLPALSAPARG